MKYTVKLTGGQLHALLGERDALRADLKAVAVALQGAEELFDNYGFADESPCARDVEIVKGMLGALARPGVVAVLEEKKKDAQ